MIIWLRRDGVWVSFPLAAPLFLFSTPEGTVGMAAEMRAPLAGLVPFAHLGTPRAALVARAGTALTLNGFTPLGVTVLRHRDEITLGGSRLVFSAFTATEPAPFSPSRDTPGTRCARCKAVLVAGEIVISCGACGAPHHQHGELACHSYDEKCGGCERRRAEIAWSPAYADDEETLHAPR